MNAKTEDIVRFVKTQYPNLTKAKQMDLMNKYSNEYTLRGRVKDIDDHNKRMVAAY